MLAGGPTASLDFYSLCTLGVIELHVMACTLVSSGFFCFTQSECLVGWYLVIGVSVLISVLNSSRCLLLEHPQQRDGKTNA